MLSPDLEDAMNTQIAAELYSHLYLAMSAYCESEGLPGFARWFRLQSDEEREHALKFVRHVVDRGGGVTLAGIDAPETDFGSPQAAFEAALAHEMNVTMMIDGLYGMAQQHGDYASQVFLQWFVTEQVEEEHGRRDRPDAEGGRRRACVAAAARPRARRPPGRRASPSRRRARSRTRARAPARAARRGRASRRGTSSGRGRAACAGADPLEHQGVRAWIT